VEIVSLTAIHLINHIVIFSPYMLPIVSRISSLSRIHGDQNPLAPYIFGEANQVAYADQT
jgi:hypothetical protein